MHKVVTASGLEFKVESFVKISDRCYDMDELNVEQRSYIAAKLNLQGIQAAYAGKLRCQGGELPALGDIFPVIKERSET